MGHNDFIIAMAVCANTLGVLLLLLTLFKYVRGKRFLSTACKVTGTLIAVDEKEDNRPAPGLSMHGESKIDTDDRLVHYRTMMYRPIVRYEGPDGKQYVLKTGFSSSKFKEPGGYAVVVFQPNTPQDARMLEFFWFWPQFVSVFGSVLLFIGICTSLMLVLV